MTAYAEDDYHIGDYIRAVTTDDMEIRLVVTGITQNEIQFRTVDTECTNAFGNACINGKIHNGTTDAFNILGYIPNAVPCIRQFKDEFSTALNWCISSALDRFPEADMPTAIQSMRVALKNGIEIQRIRVIDNSGLIRQDAYFMGFDPKGDIRIGLLDNNHIKYIIFKPWGPSIDGQFQLAGKS